MNTKTTNQKVEREERVKGKYQYNNRCDEIVNGRGSSVRSTYKETPNINTTAPPSGQCDAGGSDLLLLFINSPTISLEA